MFPIGNLVELADGVEVPIENLMAGKEILSSKAGEIVPNRIEKMEKTKMGSFVTLYIEQGLQLRACPDTRVGTRTLKGWSWRSVEAIRPGDFVCVNGGGTMAFLEVEGTSRAKGIPREVVHPILVSPKNLFVERVLCRA